MQDAYVKNMGMGPRTAGSFRRQSSRIIVVWEQPVVKSLKVSKPCSLSTSTSCYTRPAASSVFLGLGVGRSFAERHGLGFLAA